MEACEGQGGSVCSSNDFIGTSPGFLSEISKLPKVARCNSGVLILGETGTGKEVCARKIHALGARASKPFVPVNCGAIPVELAENELFGHRRGAFTGAGLSKPGLIEEAEGGTLFLDEIDSLPLLVQVKLLRFLQEKTYRPLGSTKEHPSDVRVIAATNSNPEEAVRKRKLRKDLYYRLNVIVIKLPLLKERQEDIPHLARHFLKKYGRELHRGRLDFSERAMESLLFYDWPGNVRELENVVERAVVLCESNTIRYDDISLPARDEEDGREISFQEAKEAFVEQFERKYIEKLLIAYQGNVSRAAKAAQKHRRAFWELMRKHEIDGDRFRPFAECSKSLSEDSMPL